jgi:hypothetical protein
MPALFAMYASRQEVTKVRGEAGPGNLGQEKMIQIMTSKVSSRETRGDGILMRREYQHRDKSVRDAMRTVILRSFEWPALFSKHFPLPSNENIPPNLFGQKKYLFTLRTWRATLPPSSKNPSQEHPLTILYACTYDSM